MSIRELLLYLEKEQLWFHIRVNIKRAIPKNPSDKLKTCALTLRIRNYTSETKSGHCLCYSLIFATYRKKSIQNRYCDVQRFLQQTESIVDLYQPVNQNSSHSLFDFGSLAHISWRDVEFTLNSNVTKKYQLLIPWDYKGNVVNFEMQISRLRNKRYRGNVLTSSLCM